MFGLLFTFVLLACLAIYFLVKRHAITIKKEKGFLHSLPKYYGFYASLWFSIPTICIVALYLLFAESFLPEKIPRNLFFHLISSNKHKTYNQKYKCL